MAERERGTWQRVCVWLKGEDEPVDVQTTARDWAKVVATGGEARPTDLLFQAVHNALIRTGYSVPRDYGGFLEVLDAMPETLEQGEQLSPTREDHSDAPR